MKKLSENEAVAMMNSGGFTPLEPYPGACKRWKCECEHGHVSFPCYNSVKAGCRCQKCVGKEKRLTHEQVSELCLEKGFKILEQYDNAKKPFMCKCLSCGTEEPHFLSVFRQSETCCRYCAGTKLSPEDVRKEFLALGVELLEDYKYARDPVKAKCLVCGEVYFPV